ncbi:MAG: threonine/serine exporter family protein [Fibrobacteraceae bacterium]
MKTKEELLDILDFVANYATYMQGSGVHTSRTLRCTQRIGVSQDVEILFSTFQKTMILSVYERESRETVSRVLPIPTLPISFTRNTDLGALSWDSIDENLTLEEIKTRFNALIQKPRGNPYFLLIAVGLANASFCRLFGGNLSAMAIVFVSTLLGFSIKQKLQAKGINHYLIFILSAFAASLCASISLLLDCTSEIALATSVLFLVPGVPLINGVIDIVEGHVLIGFSRLINAFLLVVCLAIGLSATLMLVKDGIV